VDVRIGVFEILEARAAPSVTMRLYTAALTRQYVSITPQAVSVWCRQLGHDTFYATYYGQADPKSLLPDDLDVVFLSSYTRASPLAYALAKLYRKEGTVTVIGGPHAAAFPQDCLRFFDVVVLQCDRTLIEEILRDPPRGEIVTSDRRLLELPSVEERLPELEATVLWRGHTYPATAIPMLTSVGCPYSCDFCIDWNRPHSLLPLDRLEADLRFISKRFPRAKIGFHDPNFAVKFDQVMDVLEQRPPGSRNPYLMECSLSLLRESRLARLRDTNCWYVAPGVESWTNYSQKSGVSVRAGGRRKLDEVVQHFELIRGYVPGIQANLIFGLDGDQGSAPIELTKEFMRRAPFVWPAMNIPVPFGGTPLFSQYRAEGRILENMPFGFYLAPYLVLVLKHYNPLEYYSQLIDLFSFWSSPGMLAKRVRAAAGPTFRVGTALHQIDWRTTLGEFRRIRDLLATDRQFRAFHERESDMLPAFYSDRYDRLLGKYAPLLSTDDRRPVLPPPLERERRVLLNPQPLTVR
jgi:radical SAM superfamily enzyme YgiQ (UPF0313 family)